MVVGLLSEHRILRPGFDEVGEPELNPLTVTWLGDLEDEVLSEASGLAASQRQRGIFFSINDSGNEPQLFALDLAGRNRGAWPVEYPGWHDFEDLSAFSWQGESYLAIADTGDNFYWRPHLTLLVIREPDLETMTPGSVITPEWQVQFRFPDGFRDIEGVAVDMEDEQFLLVSKRQVPPELFAVPLQADGIVTAGHVADLLIPQPTERDHREDPRWGYSRSMPTAFDISGRQAVIQTYKDAYLYRRGRGETWPDALAEPPQRVPLPHVHGLESVALVDGEILVTGERFEGTQRTGLFRAGD